MWLAGKSLEHVSHVTECRRSAELDRHRLGVPVGDRDSIYLRRNRDIGVLESPVLERTENFLRFRFQLLFFTCDERDDIARDVQGGEARITGSRHGLHGDDGCELHAERPMQRRQRHR